MSSEALIHRVSASIDVFAVVVLVAGVAAAFIGASIAARRDSMEAAYRALREWVGRAILLALEMLVAADIIGTIALDPTPQNLLVLAIIVLIRTFLSYSLEVEIDGRWPWQRGAKRGAPSPALNPAIPPSRIGVS
jgi:uncharacterized membrane protein